MLVLLLVLAAASRGGPPSPNDGPIAATVETSMSTAGDQIRQLAFDGDPSTAFASQAPPSADDHFTLVLERPARLQSIEATTGWTDGTEAVSSGVLEISNDGRTFRELARFDEKGVARWRGERENPAVRAVRVRPGAGLGPIVIRELKIASSPPVAVFRWPVEIVANAKDAPELKEWAEQAARACERAYPMINEELASDGFDPPRRIAMTIDPRYRGVAATMHDRIVGSPRYFSKHRDDVGAMVHETVHVVQGYARGERPSWLVEGISDYVRFFKYEPGKLGRINPETAHYDGSYRVSAAFLAHLVEKYDKDLVRKLNRALRLGRYKPELFRQLTGKDLPALDEEWRAALRPRHQEGK